jgi:hypothetical protein
MSREPDDVEVVAELVDELEPAGPVVPVDLAEVVDAEVVEWRSPLDPDHPGGKYPTGLRGGVVTSAAGRAVIERSVDYALLPWWKRWRTRRPDGYTRPLADRRDDGGQP